MNQIANTEPASNLQAARLAKGYSLEDLAVATGLTVEEIAAVEENNRSAPAGHVEHIEHALA